jgi:hypothetical protein
MSLRIKSASKSLMANPCAEAFTEEMIEIADDGTNDYVEGETVDGKPFIKLDKEHVMRSKLRIETRKWISAKLKPKKYGDMVRNEHTGAEGGPIVIQSTPLDEKL